MALLTTLLGIIAILGASPASAHAVLVSSNPADGSRLEQAPAEIHLTFSEPVSLIAGMTTVLSTTGDRADTGAPHLDRSGEGILIPLRPDLPKGSYLVTWRVVSADTHIISGSIAFGVRQAADLANTAPDVPSTSLDVVAETAQGLLYLGLIAGLGIPAVACALWPQALRRRRVRVTARLGWLLVAVASALRFLLQGPRALEAGWSGVFHLDGASQTASTDYGRELLVHVVLALALMVLAPAIARSRARLTTAFGVLVAGVLATMALAGHARVGADAWAAVPIAAVHLAAMAVWLGGLALLLMTPRETSVEIALVRTWSKIAFVSVAILIVTGEYQAWRQLKPLPSLWSTEYGTRLLIKLALVVVTLAIALVAHRALLRTEPDIRRVRRAVRVEAVVAAAVVVVATLLVSTPPAATSYGPATTLSASIGPDRLDVHVSTTRHGPEQIVVTPTSADGARLALSSLTATLSSTEHDIAGLSVRMVRAADGTWHSTGAVVPLAGRWTLTLNVSIDQATGYATRVSYDVW